MSPFLHDSPSAGPSASPSPIESELLNESLSAAPDRVGFTPEIGWRNWYVTAAGELVSPHYAGGWPARERAEAVCRCVRGISDLLHPAEHAPAADCTCGIYGLRSRELALINFAIARHGGPSGVPSDWEFAVGQVSLWGKVIEHEHGWRAEFAYPYAVRVLTPERARLVRDRYGVDVEVQP